MTRVLVVEDSADIRFILKTELEWNGFVVDTARDAKTALEMIQFVRPDVIVSDVRMPEMDGVELIRRVRQIPALQSVPAIALTGASLNSHVQDALAAGFTAHLTKPVETAELINTIHRLTEKRLQRKAG